MQKYTSNFTTDINVRISNIGNDAIIIISVIYYKSIADDNQNDGL